MTHSINYFLIALIAAGLFFLLLSDSKRLTSISLGFVMLVAFIINVQFWPWGFALSKLITGLMALLILNISPFESNQSIFGGSRSGVIFRAAVLAFGFILMLFVVDGVSIFLTINTEQIMAALFLVYCGLVQLGISKAPYKVILGLLILLLGFEIVYGSVERSLLINGMLAAVTLFIALVGSYLLNYRYSGEDQ